MLPFSKRKYLTLNDKWFREFGTKKMSNVHDCGIGTNTDYSEIEGLEMRLWKNRELGRITMSFKW